MARFPTDASITAAARALAVGDPLAALQHVALRDDPPALALHGIAMAQLGDLRRARELLRRARHAFGPKEAVPRARCILAEAEIALVSRDLGGLVPVLEKARAVLRLHGDRSNAAHAGYLVARWLLLTGRLEEAERMLGDIDTDTLSLPSRTGCWLVAAGIAMRHMQAESARSALACAWHVAGAAAIPALLAEVDRAWRRFEAPAGRLAGREGGRLLGLAEVEALLASDALVVDASCHTVQRGAQVVSLASRPVLFALVRALAEAWPGDVPRASLVRCVFGIRGADESLRARLRVEMGRLRRMLVPLAGLAATDDGFVLESSNKRGVAVLEPPVGGEHAELQALLADGGAWSSSALALALGVSGTVQRALGALAQAGKVESVGRGRACRWIASNVPGFPTSLLLPTR